MADQNITALPVSATPASSDQLLLVGATEEKLIDYDKLADAILNKLTSKTFTLDQGVMTLLKALNELNSKTQIPVITVVATDEKELCKKIADIIIKNINHATLVIVWDDHFSVGVNVYLNRSEYFIYTVQSYDTGNRYICEYLRGNISIK